MSYFSQEYLDFFTNLRNNNSKDFFDENLVKTPFKDFVNDLLVRVKQIDPNITMEAKNTIFRINNLSSILK